MKKISCSVLMFSNLTLYAVRCTREITDFALRLLYMHRIKYEMRAYAKNRFLIFMMVCIVEFSKGKISI